MLNATFRKQTAKALGAFNGYGTYQARLSSMVALCNIVCYRIKLRINCAINKVVQIFTNNRLIRRNSHNRKIVNLAEFRIFCHCGTRHT